jgi:hypothetical protein
MNHDRRAICPRKAGEKCESSWATSSLFHRPQCPARSTPYRYVDVERDGIMRRPQPTKKIPTALHLVACKFWYQAAIYLHLSVFRIHYLTSIISFRLPLLQNMFVVSGRTFFYQLLYLILFTQYEKSLFIGIGCCQPTPKINFQK